MKVAVVDQQVWRPSSTPEHAWVGCVRLSADGSKLAYAQIDDDVAGVFVEDVAGETRQVLLCQPELTPEQINWSPDGCYLSVQLGEDETARCKRIVSWFCAGEPARVEELMSSAHTWLPHSRSLAVYSSENQTLATYGVDPADQANNILLGKARDSGEPQFPPRVAVTGDGRRLALAVRSTFDERSSVWVFEQDSEQPENGSVEAVQPSASFITEVPGAQSYACPFWSPKGVSLGLMISHLERGRSGIVVFRGGRGDGEILYQSELVDPPHCPAWAPGGQAIAFMQTVDEEGFPARLALLGVKGRQIIGLSEPGQAHGVPRFLSRKKLVVDGDDAAYTFELGTK